MASHAMMLIEFPNVSPRKRDQLALTQTQSLKSMPRIKLVLKQNNVNHKESLELRESPALLNKRLPARKRKESPLKRLPVSKLNVRPPAF